MRRDIAMRFCVLSSLAVAACSSDGDILPSKQRHAPTTQDAAAMDAAVDAPIEEKDASADVKKPRDPNANCVKPGTPNNERGIGAYCESGPTDCDSTLGPRFCSADFKEIAVVEDDRWFCTTICTTSDECGTAAICATNTVGSACVPIVCIGDGGATFTALVGKDPSR